MARRLAGAKGLATSSAQVVLIPAVQKGWTEVVRRLLDARVDPDAPFISTRAWPGERQQANYTALWCAAFHNHADIAELLIHVGANPTIKPTTGSSYTTPAQIARKRRDGYVQSDPLALRLEAYEKEWVAKRRQE